MVSLAAFQRSRFLGGVCGPPLPDASNSASSSSNNCHIPQSFADGRAAPQPTPALFKHEPVSCSILNPHPRSSMACKIWRRQWHLESFVLNQAGKSSRSSNRLCLNNTVTSTQASLKHMNRVSSLSVAGDSGFCFEGPCWKRRALLGKFPCLPCIQVISGKIS